ncbi:MAG: hypothetical protein M1825_005488 [Sarcosagium campestre]|nr:MAG: hypothetical protein M1825_005488 [Sarcosagium campestre]
MNWVLSLCTGEEVVERSCFISTLDPALDAALNGGIPTGYITEITGESGAGKTQILLQLLLSAQLERPRGLCKNTLYLSTEHVLPTARLTQLLKSNSVLNSLAATESRPSLDFVLSISLPDLEAQDHIIRYQVPVAIRRHNIGLVVIDSIAANFRAEFERSSTSGSGRPAALSRRAAELIKLGSLLQNIARTFDVAVVVSNQVADRFTSTRPPSIDHLMLSSSPLYQTPFTPSRSLPHAPTDSSNPLTLDNQLRWYSGWGNPTWNHSSMSNLKTPSLGHTWALQISARIALLKQPVYGCSESTDENRVDDEAGSSERELLRWSRTFQVVFAPWTDGGGPGVDFEICAGGIRSLESAGEDLG